MNIFEFSDRNAGYSLGFECVYGNNGSIYQVRLLGERLRVELTTIFGSERSNLNFIQSPKSKVRLSTLPKNLIRFSLTWLHQISFKTAPTLQRSCATSHKLPAHQSLSEGWSSNGFVIIWSPDRKEHLSK